MNKLAIGFSALAALLGTDALTTAASQAGLLDGRVTVADSAGLTPASDFTLEAWIRPTEFHFDGPTDSSYQGIMGKWSGGGANQRCYLLAIYQDQLEFAFSLDGTAPNDAGVYSNTRLVLNEWAHVAGVYEAGTLSLFINGVEDTAQVASAGGAHNGLSPVYIGGTFNGEIDEVRISSAARYSHTFARPASEFVVDSHTLLLMHFNEGAGTFTDNESLQGGDGTLEAGSAWGPGAPIVPALLGDLNCDGVLDFFDVDPFLLALFFESQYTASYPNCDRDRADCDGNGFVDFFDVDPFLACLFSNCP